VINILDKIFLFNHTKNEDLTGAFSALTIKPNTNFNLIKKIAFVEEVCFSTMSFS